MLSSFATAVHTMLADGVTPTLSSEVLSILLILQAHLPARPLDAGLVSETDRATVEALFDAAFLLEHVSDEEAAEDISELAQTVWSLVRSSSKDGSALGQLVSSALRSKLSDTSCRVS